MEQRPVLREARAEEATAIAELLRGIMADHEKTARPLATLRRAVEHVLAMPDAWFVVAALGDELIGVVQVNERYSTWDGGHYGYIEDFFVVEGYRGRGIGALMLTHIETLAAARRWVRLDLDVLADNEATRLYRRSGYDETAYVIYRRMLTPGE